jgi:hypothetical protein
MRTRSLVCTAALTAGAALGLAGPAQAAPPTTQEGLVNVNVTDLQVQVPIGIAANICDVNVAVLAGLIEDAPADCDSSVENDVIVERSESGPVNQQGLVNVNVSGVGVQIPVGVAANVCDVNVAVLVEGVNDATPVCEADVDNDAVITPA